MGSNFNKWYQYVYLLWPNVCKIDKSIKKYTFHNLKHNVFIQIIQTNEQYLTQLHYFTLFTLVIPTREKW